MYYSYENAGKKVRIPRIRVNPNKPRNTFDPLAITQVPTGWVYRLMGKNDG